MRVAYVNFNYLFYVFEERDHFVYIAEKSKNYFMTVLFIDPGSDFSAYALWDGERIRTDKITNAEMRQFLLTVDYDHAAIEMIASYGMPVGKEVFDTCVHIGRFVELLKARKGEPELIVRLKIKMHICHSPKGNDSAIRQALIDRFGAPGTKKKQGKTYGIVKDMWAAFAGAVYALDVTNDPTLKR